MGGRLLAALIAAALICLFIPAQAMTREEMRGMYRQIDMEDGTLFAAEPDIEGFTTVGALTDAAAKYALDTVNFIRTVAGLTPVGINDLYMLRAQHAAALLAANDEISHIPENLCGMPEDIYACAFSAASACNLAKFNWMRSEILRDGIEYFVRDDGEMNLSALPHRRWVLNPAMAETGFGLARSASGMSYVSMYAVDLQRDADWSYVAWPAAGTFPVELMRSDLAWSVSVNDEIYDVNASRIHVRLTELTGGDDFSFDVTTGTGDGFCTLSKDPCGSGPCIIFRPDFDREYVQNQRWLVKVTGLLNVMGEETEIEYICDMASVHAQDVANVELSQIEAGLRPGETLTLTADVIPAYADDLHIMWTSDNNNVATVDASGAVTAIGPGMCTVTATAVNGRCDSCAVTVSE